ncbi:uncharacterized protein BN461_01370 [Bacteroides sp. CAG:1076]|nr:uncharacterized protein BN461_01370 [Bacteroides sp. CAG:1076]
MKKLVFFLVCLFTMQVVVADNDKPINFEQLPQVAQTFVKKHFANKSIAFSKVDKNLFDTTYDVMFVDGDRLEFDKQGNWKEMKCKRTSVPEAAVPAQIVKYVKTNYPDAKIIQIEKDRYEYEVKLSNFWDLKFDLKYNLIDMDRDDD